jgi:hypothetical protein
VMTALLQRHRRSIRMRDGGWTREHVKISTLPQSGWDPRGDAWTLWHHNSLAPSHALMIRIRPSLARIPWPSSASSRQWSQTRHLTTKHDGKRGRPRGQTYWHEEKEKLSTSEKYPLSQVMRDTIHPDLEPKGKARKRKTVIHGASPLSGGVHVRAQIVSPDLCGTSRPGGGVKMAV